MKSLTRLAASAALLTLGGCVVAAVPVAPPIATGAAAGQGFTCYAGVYVCTLPQSLQVGSQCSCPGLGAPSFGVVN